MALFLEVEGRQRGLDKYRIQTVNLEYVTKFWPADGHGEEATGCYFDIADPVEPGGYVMHVKASYEEVKAAIQRLGKADFRFYSNVK